MNFIFIMEEACARCYHDDYLISNWLPIFEGWITCKVYKHQYLLRFEFAWYKGGTKHTEADRSAVCQCIIQQVFDDSGMVFLCVECGVVIDPHEVQGALYQIGLFRCEPRQPFSDPWSHCHRVIAKEKGIGKPFENKNISNPWSD